MVHNVITVSLAALIAQIPSNAYNVLQEWK
jgi:hypothetical protein